MSFTARLGAVVRYPVACSIVLLSSLPMLSPSRRTLLQAMIVSLLIHAVLVLRVVSLITLQPDAPSQTIQAVMTNGKPLFTAKPPSVPDIKPLPEPVKPVSPVVRKAPVRQIAVPLPSPHTLVTAPAAVEKQDAVSAAPASPTVATAGVAPSALTPVREGVNADDMRQYRLSLASATRRFKRYPALARERGWEGTVELALNGNALSPMPEVALLHSSGYSLLDEQALEMVTQAAHATALPEGLKGRDFRVPFPVKFSLDADQ